MFANDGSIIPSWMTSLGTKAVYEDFALRAGVVIAVYPPSDPKSYSKKTTEYDVKVSYTSGSTSPSQIIYPHVTVQSLFGGVADFTDWTPRVGDTTAKTLGSKVLLLCNNAVQVDAYIVGGLKHPNSIVKDPEYKGNHRHIWEFNGVNQTVNDDGDFTLLHKGKTKDDGSVVDATNGGGLLSMTADGKISIGYLDKIGTDFASIQLDKTGKFLSTYSKNSTNIKTDASMVLTTTNGIKINPGNADQQWFLRGTIYRSQQSTLHTQLSTQLTALGVLLGTAGASLSTFPNPVAVTGAGAALTSAVALITQMVSSIQSFEAQGTRYLSTHHTFGETP